MQVKSIFGLCVSHLFLNDFPFIGLAGLRIKLRLSGGWGEFRQSHVDGHRNDEQLRQQTDPATALHSSPESGPHYAKLQPSSKSQPTIFSATATTAYEPTTGAVWLRPDYR